MEERSKKVHRDGFMRNVPLSAQSVSPVHSDTHNSCNTARKKKCSVSANTFSNMCLLQITQCINASLLAFLQLFFHGAKNAVSSPPRSKSPLSFPRGLRWGESLQERVGCHQGSPLLDFPPLLLSATLVKCNSTLCLECPLLPFPSFCPLEIKCSAQF